MADRLDELRARFPAFDRALNRRPDLAPRVEALADGGLIDGTLAKYLPDADDATLDRFVADVGTCDYDWVTRLHEAERAPATASAALVLVPVQPTRLDGPSQAAWQVEGLKTLRAGDWADVIFAGGAATRFFTEAGDDPVVQALFVQYGGQPPKGVFPLTPILGRSFLDRFTAEALETGIASGRLPPLVLMTSGQTSGAIGDWIANADHGGFPAAALWAMPQAEHPRLDPDGELVARPDGRLVVTGDGHGGVYRALLAKGPHGTSILDRLVALGVRYTLLHNVDNAASRPFEPARLGFHVAGGFGFSMTVTPRAHAYEKVGLVAKNLSIGHIEVVEYSVCPPEIAEAVHKDGSPVFELAHISVNLVTLAAVRSDLPRTLYTGKKVDVGGQVVPTASHEMLNQHLSGLLEPSDVGVLLVDRDSFFLPTKSLHGEDSLETTRLALSRADAGRLRAAGAVVADDAVVELDPCMGTGDAVSVRGGAQGWRIGSGAHLGLAVRHGLPGGLPLSPGLVLEDGARLVVAVDRPYGDPGYDAATRGIVEDAAGAGRIRLGRDVTVAAGADVLVRVRGNGVVEIPDGTRLQGTIRVDGLPGSTRTVAGSSE
jgi:UDP-N-acetylglucosamine/UDP-N-acetylgalactosamine diphosphorylase